jgi:hypothetical protein
MTKTQKTWLAVFLGMFIVPEIVFSPMLAASLFLFRGLDYHLPWGQFLWDNYLYGNHVYFLSALLIEVIGAFCLLISNVRFNRTRSKLILSVVLSILSLFLLCIFYTLFYMRHGIGF